MAKIHFFTDVDLLDTQTVADAFGPKSDANNKNRYQLSSWHTANSDPAAYAVCDGIVCLQPQDSSSTLVNLILKPLSQPAFSFPKVKYYIYRSINLDSLIDGNDIQTAGTNDLTGTIWTSFNALKASTGMTGNAPKEALGIQLTGTGFTNTDSIDKLFYREDEDIQFPVVKSGWKIGTFASAGFGFEIMTEALGFDPKLSAARAEKNLIEVDVLTGSPTHAQTFEHWHDKEEVLNYIDPSAFFGSFFNNELRVRNSNNTNIDKKSGNSLYDDVIAKFNNKNIVYLDVRNEYNFSFNYFGNYGTDVKLAYDTAGTPAGRNYYASGWPVLAIVNSDFPANNSTGKNVLKISMPGGNGDNPKPLLYISAGFLNSDYPREPKGSNKMIDLTVTSNFTDEGKLALPNRSGGNTTVVSSYIKLKYNKRFDENNPPPPSSGTVIRSQHFLDNKFIPFHINLNLNGTGNLKIKALEDEQYIDVSTISAFDFITRTGYSFNTNTVSFFVYPIFKRDIHQNTGFKFFSEIKSASTPFLDDWVFNEKDIELGLGELDITSEPEPPGYLRLFSCRSSLNAPQPEEFFSIVITKDEFDDLIALKANFIQKYNIYLGIGNETTSIDQNDIPFTSVILYICGYKLDNQEVKYHEESTTLKLFSYDNF